jgi:peptidoglycan/xylan/chitin deacetylase (PgdA/CDA1 family)
MASAHPETVRQIQAAGHSIGTHSNTHPFTSHRMSPQQADAEVEGGIASVAPALRSQRGCALLPYSWAPAQRHGEDGDAAHVVAGSK